MWLFLVKYWKLILIGGLFAYSVGATQVAETNHKLLVVERIAHATDIATFKQAQIDANARAEQIRQQLLEEAKTNEVQATANYNALLSKYRSSLVRYQTSTSSTGGASGGELPSAQSANRPGTDTQLSISLSDADICAVNTARLQAAHDWALKQGEKSQ